MEFRFPGGIPTPVSGTLRWKTANSSDSDRYVIIIFFGLVEDTLVQLGMYKLSAARSLSAHCCKKLATVHSFLRLEGSRLNTWRAAVHCPTTESKCLIYLPAEYLDGFVEIQDDVMMGGGEHHAIFNFYKTVQAFCRKIDEDGTLGVGREGRRRFGRPEVYFVVTEAPLPQNLTHGANRWYAWNVLRRVIGLGLGLGLVRVTFRIHGKASGSWC